MRWALALLLCLAALLSTSCTRSGALTFTQVTYRLHGGIGGRDLALTMQQDGRYRVSEQGRSGKQQRVSLSEFRTLQGLLASVDWPGVEPGYTDPTIADALFEQIAIKGVGKREYSTVVGTNGTPPPPTLAALLAWLQVLLKEHRPG